VIAREMLLHITLVLANLVFLLRAYGDTACKASLLSDMRYRRGVIYWLEGSWRSEWGVNVL